MNIKTDNGEILYYAAVLCQLVDEFNKCFTENSSLSKRFVSLNAHIPGIVQMKGLLERSIRRRYELEKSRCKRA